MGKKYFCDYCNKSFQDTPKARRRHLGGMAHQRNKKYYFDSFILPLAAAERIPNTTLLWSGASGEEILQLWLQCHPEVQKRFRQSSERCSRTNDVPQAGDSHSADWG